LAWTVYCLVTGLRESDRNQSPGANWREIRRGISWKFQRQSRGVQWNKSIGVIIQVLQRALISTLDLDTGISAFGFVRASRTATPRFSHGAESLLANFYLL
jgi:hypothetical protein